jgi:hypothetical protein
MIFAPAIPGVNISEADLVEIPDWYLAANGSGNILHSGSTIPVAY